MKRLVIVGGGFAGLWSALSAVRQARALGGAVQVTLVTREPEQTNRPRLYEGDLSTVRWGLADYCEPLGIDLIVDEVVAIRPDAREVALRGRAAALAYDALVLAAGSRVRRPPLPGMERVFDVDTYPAAMALRAHLAELAAAGFAAPGALGVVVVGAGLAGLELATAMPARLAGLAPAGADARVHLVERSATVPLTGTAEATAYIHRCLAEAGVEPHWGRAVRKIGAAAVTLDDGTSIPARTVVWAGGLTASLLTQQFDAERDTLGRLVVDACLSLPGRTEVFVAGDAASALADEGRIAPMSCQAAMPQGRVAGHNAVCRLLGAPPVAFHLPRYVTCVDLGPGQALFTTGWERTVSKTGQEAKAIKERIVLERIVPPRDLEAALAASAPPAG